MAPGCPRSVPAPAPMHSSRDGPKRSETSRIGQIHSSCSLEGSESAVCLVGGVSLAKPIFTLVESGGGGGAEETCPDDLGCGVLMV